MTIQEARQIINPDKELLRWGPIQGRFFLMSEFVTALFAATPRRFPGHRWPNALALTTRGTFLWLDPMEDMRHQGKKIFQTYMLPEETRAGLYLSWKRAVDRLAAIQRSMDGLTPASLTDEAFVKLWDDFYAVILDFWMDTIPAELGNYGSDRLLEDAIRSAVPAEHLGLALEVLTAPEQPSFYQEEEIALAETDDVAAHQRAYFWLKNSYAGAQVMPVKFFVERKREIPSDIRARIEARIAEVRRKKHEVIERFRIPEEAVRIADALRIGVEWQDERKKYIFQSIQYKDLLLREAARRFGYDADPLFDYGVDEIRSQVFAKTLGEKYRDRSIGGVHANWQENGQTLASHATVDAATIESLWQLYTAEHVSKDVTAFKGITACTGDGHVVRGTVRILLDPRESTAFRPGEILVTTMTTPEYVFVMKGAAAIVTDTGGLTSHAAIVSRELNVPCIVGTKVATTVLKDGDEAEVDARKGVVTILQRA